MSRRSFTIETWTEFCIGSTIVVTRVYARWKAVGFHNLRTDDYLIILLLVSLKSQRVRRLIANVITAIMVRDLLDGNHRQ
jgi:hypothetical protein